MVERETGRRSNVWFYDLGSRCVCAPTQMGRKDRSVCIVRKSSFGLLSPSFVGCQKSPKKREVRHRPDGQSHATLNGGKKYKDNMRLTAVLPHVHATKWRNCFSYFPLKLKLTACIGKHRKSLSFRSGGRPIPQIYPCCGSKKMSRRRRRGRRRDRRPIHFSGRGRALTSNEKFSGSPRVVCLRFSS